MMGDAGLDPLIKDIAQVSFWVVAIVGGLVTATLALIGAAIKKPTAS